MKQTISKSSTWCFELQLFNNKCETKSQQSIDLERVTKPMQWLWYFYHHMEKVYNSGVHSKDPPKILLDRSNNSSRRSQEKTDKYLLFSGVVWCFLCCLVLPGVVWCRLSLSVLLSGSLWCCLVFCSVVCCCLVLSGSDHGSGRPIGGGVFV